MTGELQYMRFHRLYLYKNDFKKCKKYLIFLIVCGKFKINNFKKIIKYYKNKIHYVNFKMDVDAK